MRRRLARPALAALALAACGAEPAEPELLLPDDVDVPWEVAYNATDDGLGALVPVDVMAYDGATGEPLADVKIEVWTEDDGAVAVPVEAVLVYVDADGAGEQPTPDAASDPFVAWDAARDQYIAFDVAFDARDGGADPIELHTDAGGVARLYLYVDAFPTHASAETDAEAEAAAFDPIRVVVSTGGADGLFFVAAR